MSKTVFTSKTIVLKDFEGEKDDIEIELRPLPIARKRRFMTEWSRFSEVGDDQKFDPNDPNVVEKVNDFTYDIWITCSAIALEPQLKPLVDGGTTFVNKKPSKKYQELLEAYLDQDTIEEILDICGGIDTGKIRDQGQPQAQPVEQPL